MRFSLTVGLIMSFFIHWIGLSQPLPHYQKIQNLSPPATITITLTKPLAKQPQIIENVAPIKTLSSKPQIKKVKPQKKIVPPKKALIAKKKLEKPIENIDEEIEETEANNPPTVKKMTEEEKTIAHTEEYREPKIEKPPISKVVKKIMNACAKQSYCPQPNYPFVARQRQIEGWVKLVLTINEIGTVVNVKILASEPEDMFEEATLNAVEQWRNLSEHFYNQTVEQIIYFNLHS